MANGRLLPALGLVLAFVSPPVCADADVSLRRVEIERVGVVMSIPLDWVEIDIDDLEIFSLGIAELSGGRAAETYHVGFRRSDSAGWLDLPYILLQVRESGRLRYGAILDLPPVEGIKRLSTRTLKEALGEGLTDVRLEKLEFDRSLFALRIRSIVDRRAGGPVVIETATFLTQQGVLSVHCYEIRGRFDSMLPLFESVIDSVQLVEGVRYQPGISDRWPFLTRLTWIHVVLSSAFGFLGGSIVFFIRRRQLQRPDLPSD